MKKTNILTIVFCLGFLMLPSSVAAGSISISCTDRNDGGSGVSIGTISPCDGDVQRCADEYYDCSCEGTYTITSSNNVLRSYQVDYDSIESDCRCTGGNWQGGLDGACCGDDGMADCGTTVGNFRCMKVNGQWAFIDTALIPFAVTDTGCNLIECCSNIKPNKCRYVSPDSEWKAVEGESFERNGFIYYCTDYYNWTKELDDLEQHGRGCGTTCTVAQTLDGSLAGFVFTTTECCGDDGQETYNDPTTVGNTCFRDKSACYKGEKVWDCKDIVNNGKTMVENGILYGCNVNELVKADFCETKCNGNFFCSYTGRWINGTKVRNHSSTWPLDAALKTECCAENECWNGQQCMPDQYNSSISSEQDGYRCVRGNWITAPQKYDLEGRPGFCPYPEQCLVNINGNASNNNNPLLNPICINHSQYIKNNYCELGEWTTRTKLVALQLINISMQQSPLDYAIFCGSYKDTLNYVSYIIKFQKKAEDYLQMPYTNDFCVLAYSNNNGNNVVFGTSINQPIQTQNLSFRDLIGVSSCQETNAFAQCTDPRAWYNNKTRIVIYSKNPMVINNVDWLASFTLFLKKPFETIKQLIKSGLLVEPDDYNIVDSTRRFDNLYLQRKGNKRIFGILEPRTSIEKYLAINYSNINVDVCSLVNQYAALYDVQDTLTCGTLQNSQFVIARAEGFDFDPYLIWPDLTAKLRIE